MLKFLLGSALIWHFFFINNFECGPCDYFYKGSFALKEFFENCSGALFLPNATNILETHSVISLMECQVKCTSFPGCKAVDYISSSSKENCRLFYFRHISACLSDSNTMHYSVVSITRFHGCCRMH